MKYTPETIQQIILFDWIRSQPDIEPFAFHIPNEGKRSPVYGRLLKRMGLKAGAPDIFIGIPTAHYHGLFIELKAGNNKATENQQLFLERMQSKGYCAIVCYGADEAIAEIERYLKGL